MKKQTLNDLIKKHKKGKIRVVRESKYTNKEKKLKLKIKANICVEDGKIKFVDVVPDTQTRFMLKNYFSLWGQDLDYYEEYQDFVNYIVYDLEKELHMKLKTNKDADNPFKLINGISFYKEKDIERKDKTYIISPKRK